MCLTCGCLRPHDDHGNPGHLTIEDLERSAAIDNLTLDEAVHSLRMTVEVAKLEVDPAN